MNMWTDNQIVYLKNNYITKSYKSIGDTLNKTESSVKAKCRYLGLTKVPRHIIHETFFDTWSSNMAWILGFIMADGCVEANNGRNTLSLLIDKKDMVVLRFINSQLCDKDIIEYNCYNCNQIRLRINSKYIINRLISLGITPRKTGYETMEHIPDEWKPDFIRGYFDGDGSVSFNEQKLRFGCYICGSSLDMIESIRDYFCFGKIVNTANRPSKLNKNNFYYWLVQRKCDLERFRSVLYNSGGFCLKRKYDKMMSIDTTYIKKRIYV